MPEYGKIQVREYFWSIFSLIRVVYGDLRNKCPYSVRMDENTGKKNSESGHFLRSDDHILLISTYKDQPCLPKISPTYVTFHLDPSRKYQSNKLCHFV